MLNMPPLVCPSPPPYQPNVGQDCPLYAQRLDYGTDEPLRRAILTERSRPNLGALVWADLNRQAQRTPRPQQEADWPQPGPSQPPTRPTLPPAAVLPPLPVLDQARGTTT